MDIKAAKPSLPTMPICKGSPTSPGRCRRSPRMTPGQGLESPHLKRAPGRSQVCARVSSLVPCISEEELCLDAHWRTHRAPSGTGGERAASSGPKANELMACSPPLVLSPSLINSGKLEEEEVLPEPDSSGLLFTLTHIG